MVKLKVGDKVIVLNSNHSELKVGSEHIVNFIDCDGWPEIKDSNGETWYFELHQLQKIKLGDSTMKNQNDRRHNDKGLLTLKAVSVLTFVFIVAMCAFGL